MITTEQILAARTLLDWTQKRLSDESRIGMRTVAKLETKGVEACREIYIDRIVETLEAAGVVFLPATNDRGPGVALKADLNP